MKTEMSDKTTAFNTLQTEMRACRLCLEADHWVEPPAVTQGAVSARIMTIGQAPGSTDSPDQTQLPGDDQGRPPPSTVTGANRVAHGISRTGLLTSSFSVGRLTLYTARTCR